MRFYGKRNIRNLVDKRTKKRQEMRDAILWEVDGTVCRVKIQGSGEMVVAHFPRNQKEIPLWLRKGNAVRVVHAEGIRGYLEVAGEGRSIPTPVSGGTFPDIGGLSNGILTGLVATATTPASDNVTVSAGSYRIDGVIYFMEEVTGGYMVMDDPPPMVMGELPFVLNGQVFYPLNAAPAAGLFRYDIIVIGADGDLDLIDGAAVATNPVMPSTPEDHILVCFILRVSGDVGVPNNRINQAYTTPHPTTLVMPTSLSISWSGVIDNPSVSFSIYVKDQYGHSISSAGGWVMTLTKIFGTGDIWSSQFGWDDDEVIQNLIGSSSGSFKYRRDQTASPEYKPHLQVIMTGDRSPLYGYITVILFDNMGQPI